jgi:cytochrome c nitrite reductase small subunit
VRTTPGTLLLAAAIFGGVAAGIGGYTFVYAKGYSYLTNDPAACANCHVMREQYEGWQKSSHHAVAVCNDCHTPHDRLGKYWVKGRNGFWHSFYFTTGLFPEPIRITRANAGVTQAACRHCHADMVDVVDHAAGDRGPENCVRCHASVGHLRF